MAGPQHPSCLPCDVGMQGSCQLPIRSAQGTSELPGDRREGQGLSEGWQVSPQWLTAICSLCGNNQQNREGQTAPPFATQESLVRGYPFTQQIRSERLPWGPAEALGSWPPCALGQGVRRPMPRRTEGLGARGLPASCWQESASLCGSRAPWLLSGRLCSILGDKARPARICPLLWQSAAEE